MPAELHYAADIGSLCRRREIADGHVLDHTATESAHLGHLGTSCPKGWAVDTLILADRRRPSRPLSFCRDSGFVQSPSDFLPFGIGSSRSDSPYAVDARSLGDEAAGQEQTVD